MLPSILRPSHRSASCQYNNRSNSPQSSKYASVPSGNHPDSQGRGHYHNVDNDEASTEDSASDEGDEDAEADDEEEEIENEDNESLDEDGPNDNTTLLPLFSAAHLDVLPVYALTHVIRLMITTRCETTLSWEQLRSPQVSQFLLKPIQQEIKDKHFNPATEYALMANCLQFNKEIGMYPAISGTSKTRAMVCELIAIKLLKEYTTRELIDALCYDFDPLQGQEEAEAAVLDHPRARANLQKKPHQRVARISCYEVAIRAPCKRFLAHPLVVQQLEAIWNGSIVFHSAADSMHRKESIFRPQKNYGSLNNNNNNSNRPPASKNLSHPEPSVYPGASIPIRRAATLYNPRDASLFKLSRLRVPRYRNILSTLSFAVLLSLFVAVLIQRSLDITKLEVIFWLWSAGYMLDEIVGFNEQGFSLYLASFWNVFDLGILLILLIHFCIRIYGIVTPDARKHTTARWAYDVLAADAILLFPRLFSVLDHYKYFSQLLIAFRMMASDLIAVFVLILISCSGFFVALTLSFGNDVIDTPEAVAYALLQMLMGFTPAAWDRWEGYNGLGRTILTLFLFICHFLVVTILITVLTNSFMAVVQNANEEHQFIFAINTISNVKSDALFSYVAPANIVQWVLTPLRYFIPFRKYVKINRTVIKVTHFPILFTIYLYEKTILSSAVVDSIDIVENRGRQKRNLSHNLSRLTREPSIATVRQDRALEEVFLRPFDTTSRTPRQSRDRRKTSTVVSTWMKDAEGASPPEDDDRKIVDRLERKYPFRGRMRTLSRGDRTRRTMSVASDPEDFRSNLDFFSPSSHRPATVDVTPSHVELSQHTDADGDDELVTEETSRDEVTSPDISRAEIFRPASRQERLPLGREYFTLRKSPLTRTPNITAHSSTAAPPHLVETTDEGEQNFHKSQSRSQAEVRSPRHFRNASSATMIYKPTINIDEPTDTASPCATAPELADTFLAIPNTDSGPGSCTQSPVSGSKPSSNATGLGRRTPKRPSHLSHQDSQLPPHKRPILPGKGSLAFQSAPNITEVLHRNPAPKVLPESQHKGRTSLEMDLVSDIGDNKAIGGGYVGAIPASIISQMALAGGAVRNPQLQHQWDRERERDKERTEKQEMFGRLMMARMNSLEEGFRDVIHEMRESLKGDSTRAGTRVGTRSNSRERERMGNKERDHTKEKEKKITKDRDIGRPSTAGGSFKAQKAL